LRNKLFIPVFVLLLLVVIFQTSCGGGGGGSVVNPDGTLAPRAYETDNCYNDAKIFVSGNSFDSIQLFPPGKNARCSDSSALNDIFLYSAIGNVSKDQTSASLTSLGVLPSCSIRGSDWSKLDEKRLVNGNEVLLLVLCGKKAGGTSGPRVMDAVKVTRSNALLPGGPDCEDAGTSVDGQVCVPDDDAGGYCFYGGGYCDPDAQDCPNYDEYTPDSCERNGYCLNSGDVCNEVHSPCASGDICMMPGECATGSGSLSDYIHRGGFYSYATKTSYSLCAPTRLTGTINAAVPFTPFCDNDFICTQSERALSCSDCVPCEQRATGYSAGGYSANAQNILQCQGDLNFIGDLSRNIQCKYCPKTTGDQDLVNPRKSFMSLGYPYLLPDGSYSTDADAQFGCVNISAGDPFNCGGCGFSDIPSGELEVATGSLCRGKSDEVKPYCVKTDADLDLWSCAGTEERDNPAGSPWFLKFAGKGANPTYYYTASGSDSEGYKSTSFNVQPGQGGSFSVSQGVTTGVAYPVDSFDDDEASCQRTAGAGAEFSDDFGCCGGGKARYPPGEMCEAKAICDGVRWYEAEEDDGMVFKLNQNFEIPYPIAAVDGSLTLCVDDSHYVQFTNDRMSAMTDEDRYCIPLEALNASTESPCVSTEFFNCTSTEGEEVGSEDLDYNCPAGKYWAGGNHVVMGQVCRNSHDANDRDGALQYGPGLFICAPENTDGGSLWGHAYLFSGDGKSLPIPGDDATESPLFGDGVRCPSAIHSPWIGPDETPISVIGCPGSVPVTVDGPTFPMPFGSPEGRMTYLCLNRNPEVNLYDDFFKHMNYVRANNTIMGSSHGHQYLCTKGVSTTPNPYPEISTSKIAICCGSQGCDDLTNLQQGYQKYDPGQFVRVEVFALHNYSLYCRSDGTWGRNLDDDPGACNAITRGLAWTGHYCCSEGGDDNTNLYFQLPWYEWYSDAGSSLGACFNSKLQPNNAFLNGVSSGNVFTQNGQFYGCTPGEMYRPPERNLPAGNVLLPEPGKAAWWNTDIAFNYLSHTALAAWGNSETAAYGQLLSLSGTKLGGNIRLDAGHGSMGVSVISSTENDLFLTMYGSTRGSIVNATSGEVIRRDFEIAGGAFAAPSRQAGKSDYSSALHKFLTVLTANERTKVIGISLDGSSTVFASLEAQGYTDRQGVGSVAAGRNEVVAVWLGCQGDYVKCGWFVAIINNSGGLKQVNVADIGNPASFNTSGINKSNLENSSMIHGRFYDGIWPFYQNKSDSYDLIYVKSERDGLYLKKRVLSSAGVLGTEINLLTPTSGSSKTRYPFGWIGDVTYSPSRDSYFVLTTRVGESINFIEVSPDGRFVSDIYDVSQETGSQRRNFNPSVTDADGVPYTVMNVNDGIGLHAQFGALAPIWENDWPNPGTGRHTTNKHKNVVQYQPTCSQMNLGGAERACTANGVWSTSSSDLGRTRLSTVPTPLLSYLRNLKNNSGLSSASCCTETTCWDPARNSCVVQDRYNEYYSINESTTYKCINGVWGEVGAERYTPNNCMGGFCSVAGQCFYSASGNPADNGNVSGNPQCLNSGQFKGDALCMNGSWSSRTRLVANSLLKLVGSNDNYVLSCGPPENVLFKTQTPGQVNSYCVLDLRPGTSSNQRIFGASLNQEVEQVGDAPGQDYIYAIKRSFYEAYPGSTFTSATNCRSSPLSDACATGQGSNTGGSSTTRLLNLYYDNNTKIVFFSDKSLSVDSPGLVRTVCSWLPSWLQWLCPKESPLAMSIKNLTFDRLYAGSISSGGASKSILGTSRSSCECTSCSPSDTFRFTYTGTGYSKNDFITFFGNNESISSDAYSINETSGVLSVSIKNPTGIDKNALWYSLTFIKGYD
jgi:hypothetical protein